MIFASVSSCLSWEVVKTSHWSGPGLWYSSIVLALACIFTGVQQSLVLPEAEALDKMSYDEVETMRLAFLGDAQTSESPSYSVLVAWQVPIMLLGYAVLSFVAGLCSVVLTPLARDTRWDAEAKVGLKTCTNTY